MFFPSDLGVLLSLLKYQIYVFHLVLILSETPEVKSKVPDSGDKVDSGVGLRSTLG
jgi:hypothetical protein